MIALRDASTTPVRCPVVTVSLIAVHVFALRERSDKLHQAWELTKPALR